MNTQFQDFEKNIIKKYSKDINNIFMIEDYIILENLEECNTIISEIFNSEGEKIINQNNGAFSILINNKFLLIAKKDELITIFKTIYHFLLFISKNIDSQKIFILTNLKEILSLINLVLLFNDNITFYALKKKIFLLVTNKINNNDIIKNLNLIILSEYHFTCITNKKCRKSSISWDYKYFLFHNFKNDIFFKEKNNEYNSEYIIFNLLKNELNIIGINKFIFYNNLFILKDLEIINEININQSRNCHMWAYLRKVYNEENKEGKILIILFAFLTLRKCCFDYSAFSFIVNSKNNIPLNKEQIKTLIKETSKNSFTIYDDHKCYIDNLEKYLFN